MLQKTVGLSFPMAEGQTEEALKTRLTSNAEGKRRKDERVIHVRAQEMTRRRGSKKVLIKRVMKQVVDWVELIWLSLNIVLSI